MTDQQLSSTVSPGAAKTAGELESLLAELRLELESDVLYCTTRDQHIRAVRRVAQVVHIIEMVG